MKTRLLLIYTFILCLFSLTVVSCEDKNDSDAFSDNLYIKDVQPKKEVPRKHISERDKGLRKNLQWELSHNITESNSERRGLNKMYIKVPVGFQGGHIKFKTEDSELTNEKELLWARPEILNSYPTELKTGETLIVKGNDLKSIKQATFDDKVTLPAVDFIRKNDSEIQIRIPRGTNNGENTVKLITYDDKELLVGVVNIEVINEPDPGDGSIKIILFEGEFDLGNWSGDLLIPTSLFVGVKADADFVVEYEMTDSWGNLKVKRSDALNDTFENSTPNGWGIDLVGESTSFTFKVTQGDIDLIATLVDDNFALQGSNAIIKKVYVETITEPSTSEIVIFEDEFDIGNWSNDLLIPNSLMSGVSAGSMMIVEYEMTDSWGNLKVKRSDALNDTFENSIPNGWGIDLPGGSTSFSFEITQGDLDVIASQPDDNLAIQGSNAIIKKVYIVEETPKPAEEFYIFEDEFDLGSWNADLEIPNSKLSSVVAGNTMTIEYEMTDTWGSMKVKRSNALNDTFVNSMTNDWGGVDLAGGSNSFSFEITQDDLDLIASQPGDNIALQGCNAIVKAIYITP